MANGTGSALSTLQQTSMSAAINKQSGAGKAYQAVAQSSAIAIQDATDTMRNVQTMASTAKGVALAQLLATQDIPTFTAIVAAIEAMETGGITNFTAVGTAATNLASTFPSG